MTPDTLASEAMQSLRHYAFVVQGLHLPRGHLLAPAGVLFGILAVWTLAPLLLSAILFPPERSESP